MGGLQEGSLHSQKKNKAACFNFAREHLDKPKPFWKSILWTDEFKIELFGHNQNHHVWRIANTAYEQKNLLPTVKHGSGNVRVWGCFSASGPGRCISTNFWPESPAISQGVEAGIKMDYATRQWPKAFQLKYKGMASEKEYSYSYWPSQSLDLNPIEMLWRDLKKLPNWVLQGGVGKNPHKQMRETG